MNIYISHRLIPMPSDNELYIYNIYYIYINIETRLLYLANYVQNLWPSKKNEIAAPLNCFYNTLKQFICYNAKI